MVRSMVRKPWTGRGAVIKAVRAHRWDSCTGDVGKAKGTRGRHLSYRVDPLWQDMGDDCPGSHVGGPVISLVDDGPSQLGFGQDRWFYSKP